MAQDCENLPLSNRECKLFHRCKIAKDFGETLELDGVLFAENFGIGAFLIYKSGRDLGRSFLSEAEEGVFLDSIVTWHD